MNKYFLTEDQLSIQEMAKKFSDEQVQPVTVELDQKHLFPEDLVKQCGEMMFLGACIPEEYGGAGLDCLSHILIMEQLARHSSSLASIIDAHTSLGAMPLLHAGTEEQKQKYLAPAAAGETLCSFALTEPQSGSDSGGLRTTAVLDGNEWVINGSKSFITNIGYSKTFVVAAKTDLEAKGSRGISIFIVEAGTPGFEIGKPEMKMSNQSSYSGPLFFTDCRIPKENLLGELNRGFPLFMSCVDEGRLAIAAVAVGMAQGVLERAARYAKERVAFGNPISKYQGISFKLADMATAIEHARVLLYHGCRLRDAGLPFAQEAAMIKLYSSEMCVDVCDKGVQILGGYGLCVEYELERFYRDAKLLTIGEGTSEICRIVISGNVLKQY
jgi:butyryl-CoA dehydrogenase